MGKTTGDEKNSLASVGKMIKSLRDYQDERTRREGVLRLHHAEWAHLLSERERRLGLEPTESNAEEEKSAEKPAEIDEMEKEEEGRDMTPAIDAVDQKTKSTKR